MEVTEGDRDTVSMCGFMLLEDAKDAAEGTLDEDALEWLEDDETLLDLDDFAEAFDFGLDLSVGLDHEQFVEQLR